MPTGLWVCLSLYAALPSAEVTGERLLERELTAEAGMFASGFDHGTGRSGDAFVGAGVSGRERLGGLLVDGELFTATPTRPAGADFSGLLTLRAGWSGQRWAVLAGVFLQWTPAALTPLQILPSLHARYQFRTVALSFGVMEDHGYAPLHLTLENDAVAIGYVAPLGVRAILRLPSPSSFRLELRALAVRIASTQLGLLTLAGTLGGGGR